MKTQLNVTRDVWRVTRRANTAPFRHHASRLTDHASRLAFSLVELMIAMALMTVIIFGLLTMFNQTQKAFRAGMTQVDVLEAGRMATDLIVRELEQVTPSYQGETVNFSITNYMFLPQPLAASTDPRDNLYDEIYFLSRENQMWRGIGYLVYLDSTGVGTLYRFYQETNVLTRRSANLYTNFHTALINSMSRIMDGVVHFRVRAYSTNGVSVPLGNAANTILSWNPNPAFPLGETNFLFLGNAVPAFVELELGILEQGAYERLKSIPDPTAQANYLSKQAGRVHLFRQRIQIRAVDPTAYQ